MAGVDPAISSSTVPRQVAGSVADHAVKLKLFFWPARS